MKTLVAWLLVFGWLGTAWAQDAVRSYHYDVAVDIDPQGHVVHVALPDDVPEVFAPTLRDTATKWRFNPAMKHGVAVTARTYAKVAVMVVAQGDDKYGLKIERQSNGPGLTLSGIPPYPPELVRDRVEGTVLMTAVVQPDGTVTDIQVKDIKLVEYSVSKPGRAKKLFGEAATVAMQTLQAKPEWIDGSPVASNIELPINFNLNGSPGG